MHTLLTLLGAGTVCGITNLFLHPLNGDNDTYLAVLKTSRVKTNKVLFFETGLPLASIRLAVKTQQSSVFNRNVRHCALLHTSPHLIFHKP